MRTAHPFPRPQAVSRTTTALSSARHAPAPCRAGDSRGRAMLQRLVRPPRPTRDTPQDRGSAPGSFGRRRAGTPGVGELTGTALSIAHSGRRSESRAASAGRTGCHPHPTAHPRDARAAAVGLYVQFRLRQRVGSILNPGVARRSFRLLRRDLLLQIDPSAPGPRAGYILRRGPLITSFLSARRSAEGPRGYGPFYPHVSLPRVSCYHTTLPPHHRRAASASASTPPATATRPSSSATTFSPLPPNSSSPSPPLAMPSSASASINWLSNTALSTSSSASMRPDNMPTICSTSCTAWAPPAATLPVPPLPSASLCPAVIPNATRATAPLSLVARSRILSRPALPPASP